MYGKPLVSFIRSRGKPKSVVDCDILSLVICNQEVDLLVRTLASTFVFACVICPLRGFITEHDVTGGGDRTQLCTTMSERGDVNHDRFLFSTDPPFLLRV